MIYFLKLAAEIAEIRLRLQGYNLKICKKIFSKLHLQWIVSYKTIPKAFSIEFNIK
jgi:hypothetical protein